MTKIKEKDQEQVLEAFVKAMNEDDCGWCNQYIGYATAKLVKILHNIKL